MVTSRLCTALVLCLIITGAGVRSAAAKPPPPVAAVFLVESSRLFMGNGSYERPNDCRGYAGPPPCRIVKAIPGAYQETRAALGDGRQAVAARLGPAAQAALVTYGVHTRVLAPLGPARRVTGKRLGSQRSFAHENHDDLLGGLEAAFDLLDKAGADRKVVFVIGGGVLKEDVRAPLKARFAAAGIAIVFLELHPSMELLPLDQDTLDSLGRQAVALTRGDDGSRAVSVASPAALASALQAEVDRWRTATP